ncbi:MAG: hypothetical protein U0166_26380 [Acidobacteriota bacterium]
MIAGIAALATLPAVVEPLDDPRFAVDPSGIAMQVAKVAGEANAPSPAGTSFTLPALGSGEHARVWLVVVPAEARRGMDGVSFHLKGSGTGDDATIVLRAGDGEAARDYVSDVLLASHLWHRVYLPFSEFFDPTTKGRYPVARLPADLPGEVRVGIEVAGPTRAPMTFVLDSLGFTTNDEVRRALGWRTFMPPSHGFPPWLDRFDGPLRWTGSARGAARIVPLEGFPHEGFEHGLEVLLPASASSVSTVLEPREALPLYEGIGFWVKGDGRDHVLRLACQGDDGTPYLFPTPVRGTAWKLVFAGFENFKHEGHELEVEDAGALRLTVSLDPTSKPPAKITLGPFRLGYEK